MGSRIYNLGHLFQEIVNEFSTNRSLCIENECLTFNEIDAYSSKVANYFFEIGLRAHDVIAISAHKQKINYGIALACIKLGVTYSFFDPSAPVYRLNKQFKLLDPKCIIISDADNREDFKFEYNVLETKSIINGCDLQSVTTYFDTEQVPDSTIAYVMFTSGSTGDPKGVSISHRSVINFIDWIRNDLEISELDRVTGLNKLFFDNSVFDFYATFFTGACLYPVKEDILNDSVRLFSYLVSNKISVWFSVPSLIVYHLTVSLDSCASFKALKKIIFGGEGFPKNNLIKLWEIAKSSTKLINVYGPPECTCICSSYDISEVSFKQENIDKLAPIGRICRNTDYVIVKDGRECSIGEVGELYIGGVSVGSGYWNNEKLTNEKFIQNPLHSKYTDIFYASGDLVRLNRDNNLEFVSRTDFQIKHMGYRIELSEIENTLQISEEIYESCSVYKNMDKMEGQGFIKLFYSGSMTENRVIEFLSERLPKYMLPRMVIQLEQLPKNSNGKIDRKKLLET